MDRTIDNKKKEKETLEDGGEQTEGEGPDDL